MKENQNFAFVCHVVASTPGRYLNEIFELSLDYSESMFRDLEPRINFLPETWYQQLQPWLQGGGFKGSVLDSYHSTGCSPLAAICDLQGRWTSCLNLLGNQTARKVLKYILRKTKTGCSVLIICIT